MKLKTLTLSVIAVLILSACGTATTPAPTPDLAALRTSAVQTAVAEITLTAASIPPTPVPSETPAPTFTPLPTETLSTPGVMITDLTSGLPVLASFTPLPCDAMSFDVLSVDVNIPDGTEMAPNQEFVKTWKIRNTGSCTWGAGYSLIYSYGERMSGQPQPLAGAVAPGQEVEVSVSFKTPAKANEYVSAWIMANARGFSFGKALFVKIIVK
ncbi:MAG: NBR1-Ig-like domain-containing protein [Chloroflexota bacterium]